MRRPTLMSGLSLLAVAVIAGCGSNDSHDQDAASTPAPRDDPQAALQVAAKEWADALYGGNPGAAYALFTDRCKSGLSLEEFAPFAEYAQTDPGMPIKITVRVDGDRGYVNQQFADASSNTVDTPWTVEKGAWRTDDCGEIGR